jgi:sterol desaturase/sphingolipid hydroxylase (fatty acid hydroxylase superfamily)
VKQVVKDIVYIRLTLFAATVPERLGGGVATWIEERRAHLLPFVPWPTSAPLFVRTLLAIFVIENGAYWAHRLSHNTALLWQFHATHHAVREMYSLRGARNHPLDIIWIGLPAIPLAAFFGIGEEELTYAFGFALFVNILAHANILGVSPILGWFVTAPEHHWVHHSQDVAESRSNFACGLILLDRLYGTFRPHTQKLCLGLEGRPGDSLKAELLEPFYKKLAGEYREGARPPAAEEAGGG